MSGYSDFLKYLGIDKKQMIASMWSKIPESEKPSKRGREMTKEELEKEAEDKGEKYVDSLECTITMYSDEVGYCWEQVVQAYEKGALDFAQPREKRIAELEKESRAKENCWNCAYFKEKKYQACVDIKKNNTIRCAFYKWEGEKY